MRTESYEGCTKREFLLYGRKTIIVEPEHALPGKPWVWRTEFFGAFPSADNALLKMGFHLAYHSASDMYGCPEADARRTTAFLAPNFLHSAGMNSGASFSASFISSVSPSR